MRPRNEVWQGYCGYWQDRFIRENLLPLGHAAWQGYINQERGMVVCDVAMPTARCANANVGAVDWCSDTLENTIRFVPLSNVSAYLQTLNLEAALIEHLIDTVRVYDPTQQVVLLINANGQVEIDMLQHLAIAPADCYQQMQRRWSEFQLENPTLRRKL